jgi:hypothetical protein
MNRFQPQGKKQTGKKKPQIPGHEFSRLSQYAGPERNVAHVKKPSAEAKKYLIGEARRDASHC